MQAYQTPAAVGLYGATPEGVDKWKIETLATPFCFLAEGARLAPSFLTPGGTGWIPGLQLWYNVVLHLVATSLVISANVIYNDNDKHKYSNLRNGMSGAAIGFQLVAVLGTVVSTGAFFRAARYPFVNAFGITCFILAILFNFLGYIIYYIAHVKAEDEILTAEGTAAALALVAGTNTTAELSAHEPTEAQVHYPVGLVFQVYAFATILSNAFALAKQRDVREDL